MLTYFYYYYVETRKCQALATGFTKQEAEFIIIIIKNHEL